MKAISEKDFKRLVDYVRSHYGVNLEDKKTLVEGRLKNHLIKSKYTDFSDYFEYVISDKSGKAIADLIDKLTTNHTFFMREAKHFEYFRDIVLPYLAKTEYMRKDLRIWSAGCSTGEEPYTLAMLLADYFFNDKHLWDTKVLATDISTKVLKEAIEGIYQTERLLNLPERWRKSYFQRVDDKLSVITEKIKNEVIFRKFNLMEGIFPFKKDFHVIFCRNVMIYFDAKTRNELVEKFYNMTCSGGYLFIGHSESLGRGETKYRYVIPAVYRKD